MSDRSTTFSTLRDANLHRQSLWDREGVIDVAYRGNEMAGEIGEAVDEILSRLLLIANLTATAGRACNLAKKIERERRGLRGFRATSAELAAELADIVICVDLIAIGEDIDLDRAVADKFNATSEKVGLPTRLRLLTPGDPVKVWNAALEAAKGGVDRHNKTGRDYVNGSLWDTLSREAADRIDRLRLVAAADLPRLTELAPTRTKSLPSSRADAFSTRMIEYQDGSIGMLMFHWMVEGQSLADVAKAGGFDIQYHEMGEDDPLWARYEAGEGIMREWRPPPPAGWQLALVYDSDDGPIALFVRAAEASAECS